MANAISYIKNVGKSVAFTTIDAVKEMNPVFNDFAETNGELLNDMYKSVRNLKSKSKKLPNRIMDSPYGEFGATFLKNLTSDLKSGKFYNKERKLQYEDEAANAYMGLDGNDFSFDEGNDFNFDDDSFGSSNEPSTNEMIDIVGEKTSNAISNTMARSSEYIVQGVTQSNKAIYNRMNDIYGGLHASMATINQNISKMMEFSAEATVTHYENSRNFFLESTKLDQERNQYLKEIAEGVKQLNAPTPKQDPRYKKNTYSDVVNYNGVLDINQYFEVIKKNLNDKSYGMGDMLNMAVESGMLKTMTATPVSDIAKLIVTESMPLILRESFDNFNKSLSGIMGNALLKLKEKGKYGGIWGTISDIFGIDTGLKTTLNTSNYEKGKIPFDGVTKKAITEVIPTYLSKILVAIDHNQKENRFNYDTGKFVTLDQLETEFSNLTKDSSRRAAYGIDQVVRDKKKSLQWDSDDQRRQFEDDWEAIKEYMYRNQKTFNTRDKSLTGKSFGLKGGMASDVNVRIIQEILDGNPEMMKYADEMLRERSNQNRRMAEYETGSVMNTLFNGSAGDYVLTEKEKKEEEKRNKNKSLFQKIRDKKKQKEEEKPVEKVYKSAFVNHKDDERSELSELIQIHKELSYIRMYGAGRPSSSNIGSSGYTQTDSGIILPDGITPSFDNFEIPEPKIRNGNDKEYDKNNQKGTTDKVNNIRNNSVDDVVSRIISKSRKEQEDKNNKTASKSFSMRMNEAAGITAKMSVLASSATELAKKPIKFIVSVMDKADQRLYDLIYGTKEDKDGNKSFAGRLFKGLENMFDKFANFVDESIISPLKDKFNKENIHDAAKKFFNIFGIDLDDTVAKTREYLFGKKDKDGNRTKDGIFSKFTDDVKDAFKSAKDWVKGAFRDVADWTGTSSKKNKSGKEKDKRNAERDSQINYFEDIVKRATATTSEAPEAATGIKRVNKTGLAVISEGEAIIPPDMNPFNISKRRRNEKQVKRNLKNSIDSVFEYYKGTDNATSGKESKDIQNLIKNNQISEEQRRHNNETKARIASQKADKIRKEKEKYTNEDYEEGRNPFVDRVGDELHNGIKAIFDRIQEALGIDEENRDKNNEKFKKNASDYIAKFKEYSGTMAAGGVIGAGVSVVTGMIGGPLLGAAVGAGIGLIKKSETVQKMLFGETDEKGQYKGGLISKDLSNNIKKYFGDMSKGATVGGILSLLPFVPGGPVTGVILGSAIGFAKNNEGVQNALFGEGKLLGKKEDFQKKVQSVLPKMGAGALVGLLGGPFGIGTNILLGSALGFATDTNRFKDLVFGEVNPETGKRDEGGLMRAITKPATDFFQKMYGELKEFVFKKMVQPVADALDPIKKQLQIMGRSLTGMFADTFKKTIGAPIERFLKENIINPLGKRLGSFFNTLLKPVKFAASLPFRAVGRVGDALRVHQVKTGQADYMGAEQRNAFRRSKKIKMGPGDRYRGLDESLANMNTEDIDVITNALAGVVGSSKKIGVAERDAFKSIRKEIYSDKNGVDTDTAKAALDMVKHGAYEQAEKFVKEANIDDKAKTRILTTMAKESAKLKINKQMREDRSGTINQIAEQAKSLGLDLSPAQIEKMAKGDKETQKIYEYLVGEQKYREKYKQKDEDKKQPGGTLSGLNEEQQKRHDEIVNALIKITDILSKKYNYQKGDINESPAYKEQINNQTSRFDFVSGNSNNTEDEHPDLEETYEYNPRLKKAAKAVKKGIGIGIKAPFKGAKAAYRGVKREATAIRNTKVVNSVLGDRNTDWRNPETENKIKSTINNATDKAKKKLGIVSKGEYIAEVDKEDIDNAQENAVGGFGGNKNDKFTIKGFFKDISNNIKKVAGNISAMALKDGIDTSNISEKDSSDSYLSKVKNKFKKGLSTVTQFVDGLPIKYKKDKNGDLVEDTGSAENKDSHKKLEEKESVQKGILSGITGLGATVSGFFGRFFDKKKDKDKESIFSKIWKFLAGGGLGSVIGLAIKGLGSLLSAAVKSAIPLLITKLALDGKFDGLANKLTGGAFGKQGTNDIKTVIDENGERREIQVDENGNPVLDENGNYIAVNGDIISNTGENDPMPNGSLANMSLSERLKYNAVRGTITGKGFIVGSVVKSTPIGKIVSKGAGVVKEGISKVASSAIKSATDDAVLKEVIGSTSENINKWCKALRKVPLIGSKFADALNGLGIKFMELVYKYLPKSGSALKSLSNAFAKLNVFLAAATIIVDFTTGYQDASTTLKVKTESLTTPQKIICGLIRTVKNFVPIVGTLIPDQIITDFFIDYVASWFGINVSEIKQSQDEAQAELDEYNEANGTDYDWSTYNKAILGNYTWTENIGNGFKEHGIFGAAGAAVKEVGKGALGIVKGVGKGALGVGKGAVNLVKNSFVGKAVGAGVNAVKDVFNPVKEVGTYAVNVVKDSWKEIISGEDIKSENLAIKEDDPYGDYKKIAYNTIKILGFIPGSIIKIGRTIWTKGIKPFISGVVTVGSGIGNTVSDLFSKSWKGQFIEAITDTSGDAKTYNNGLNLLSASINGVIKSILTPAALLTTGVGYVARGISDFIDAAKTVGSSIGDTVTNIMKTATEGKNPAKEIFTTKYDANTGNGLVDTISSVINGVIKVPLTPIAFLTAGVSFVKNKVVGFFDTIAKAGTLSEADKKIIEDSKDGDVNPFTANYWKTHSSLTGVAGGLTTFITLMNKVFNLPLALVGYLNPIKLLKRGGDWLLKKLGIDDSETYDVTAGSGSGIVGRGSKIPGFAGRGSSDGTFISQVDSKYRNIPFNISGDTERQTLGDSGCAPAAAAMAINATNARGSYTSMEEASKNALRYKEKNDGVNANYFSDEFSRHGINAEYTTDTVNIMDNLTRNNNVVLMGQDRSNTSKANSPFGPNPHYVVANGLSDDGKSIYINDPEQGTPNTKYSTSKVLGKSQLGIAAKGSKHKTLSKLKNRIPKPKYLSGRGALSNYKLSKYIGRSAYGKDTIQYKVWTGLIGAGFTEYQAAGIMGCMQGESEFKPDVIEYGNGIGFGLCQWSFGRRTQLENYAASKGVSASNVDTQLEFLIAECTPGGSSFADYQFMAVDANGGHHPDEFWKATSPAEATRGFLWCWERPNEEYARESVRLEAADMYYKAFKGTPGRKLDATIGDAGLTSSSSDSSSNNSNDNNNSNESKSNGILSRLLSAYTGIGEAYGLVDSSSSSSSSSNGGSDGSSSGGTSSGGTVSPDASIAEKQKAIVDKATSIKGTISYSMEGPRDPDQGSADCSSFVNWAYKKTVGTDIGGYTGAQTGSSGETDTMYTVDQGGGTSSDVPDESKLQLGDLLYYTRDYSTGSSAYPMDIGHVGMYMGDGKEIHHPGGTGPQEKPLSEANRFRLAMRLKQFKGEGSGLLPNGRGVLQDPNKFKDEANAVKKSERKLKQQYSLLSKKTGKGSYQVMNSESYVKPIHNSSSSYDDKEFDQSQYIENKNTVNKFNKLTKSVARGSNSQLNKPNINSAYNKQTGRASDINTVSKSDINSSVLIQLVKTILQMMGKLVTNTDQLNNIAKLLGEYIAVADKSDGSEQSKQKTALVRQNLITALQGNNSDKPNDEITKLIRATEKIAME